MEIIIHKVNSLKKLIEIPNNFGCEIDIRVYNNEIILNHEPFKDGEKFDDFIRNYRKGTLVLNIKESGIEDLVIKKVKKENIKSFFLLDVEYPYFFSSRNKQIASRFSIFEPIENSLLLKDKVDWIWIDSYKANPIKKQNLSFLKNFNSCYVCPSRWGRSNEIQLTLDFFQELKFFPNCIMTDLKYSEIWLK